MTAWLTSESLLLATLLFGLVLNGVIWLGLKRGWTAGRCVWFGWMALVLTFIIILVISRQAWNLDIMAGWKSQFLASLKQSVEIYRSMGWDQNELLRIEKLMHRFFVDGIYGWLAVIAVGLSYIAYLFQRRIAPGLPGSKLPLKPFVLWSNPDHFVWVLLLALGSVLLGSRFPGWLGTAGLNMIIPLASAYLLVGMAVFMFYLKKITQPHLRVLLVLAMMLFPAALFFITLLGLFDTWWDWRQMNRIKVIT